MQNSFIKTNGRSVARWSLNIFIERKSSKMPPKKKRVTLNSVVVGTVSTRSTRRQSVVNIQIPKSTRSNKFKTAIEAEELSSRIKKSYKSFMDANDGSFAAAKTNNDTADRDNKALLQILQDWDDIEDEDQVSQSVSHHQYSDKNINEDDIKCDVNESVSEFSDLKQIELTLSQGLETEDENNSNPIEISEGELNTSQVTDEDSSEKENKVKEDETKADDTEDSNLEIVKSDNSLSLQGSIVTETEELIIEEQASIPYADDMIVDNNVSSTSLIDKEVPDSSEPLISEENSTAFESNSQFVEQIESSSSETSQPNRELEKIINKNEESNFSCQSVDMEYIPVSNEENKQNIIRKYSQEETSNSDVIVEFDNSDNAKMEESNTVGSEIFDENSMDHSGINDKATNNKEDKSNDSIEDRVAEMHLTGDKKENSPPKELVTDDDKVNKQSDDNEHVKTASDKKPAGQTLFLEDVANNPPIIKLKSKKPKPKQDKNILPKQDEKIKMVKPRPIKSPPLKPTKDTTKNNKKPIKKESEKKDKKSGKSEETIKNKMEIEDEEKVRRSSRIKSISVLNKKTTGWGLVKSKSESSLNESDMSDSSSLQAESEKSTPTASPKINSRDKKWKSNELLALSNNSHNVLPFKTEELNKRPRKDPVVEARLKQFVHLKENQYRTDRMMCKEAKKMVCDCFLTSEELEANEYGCGEDCLNRLLLIECGNLCTVGDRCTNKRFQRSAFAPVEVFNTEKKGLGLRAAANIAFGEFILEYVGEVLDADEFDKRAEVYSQDKNIHYYFMALRADAIIDATMKGNISRFINHSCDPNAETQKWTVNGELRIGFFSTRTILAGEEITFDYRFQRYGKEAQKCYCGASICRGWLGEQPDSDEEEDEEEEDEIEETKPTTLESTIKNVITTSLSTEIKDEIKSEYTKSDKEAMGKDSSQTAASSVKPVIKKKVQKKKPRIEMFEEVDQLNEEIEMLVTTGLKNQAHTLKVSRLMVRAKEPQQRAKLLRILRRGELPCRRLFLDYHGLRLMHGYMIDAQQLAVANKQFESLRLEVLQTLAVLPIPNKTMLQDSKVLSTVELWASHKDLSSPPDSDSNSPKTESDLARKPKPELKGTIKDESVSEKRIEDQEEEIRFLASKLLEEWKNLKEVFRIPKKERIEQMKEHEREANKKFMQNTNNQNAYALEDDRDKDRKSDRYRGMSRFKSDRDSHNRKPTKSGEKLSAEYLRLSRVERRKLFALQHELKEEERKLKQREMWRQHEANCMMIGADPRFTAPFDPNRGYQLIWNPQIGQWQNCPLPSPSRMYPTQHPLPHMSNINLPHHSKSLPPYPPLNLQNNMNLTQPPLPPLPSNSLPGHLPPTHLSHPNIQGHLPPQGHLPSQLPQMHHAQGHLPQNNPYGHIPLPQTNIPISIPPLPAGIPPLQNAQTQIQQSMEEDPSQVKFLGPIPPPVKLPPKWKCAKDKYGRPYYYHIKIRKSQWEPPPIEEQPESANSAVLPFPVSDSESSSETSSVSSDSSSENSDSDEDVDDTRLLLEVRKQMETLPKLAPDNVLYDTPITTPSPDDEKHLENEMDVDEIIRRNVQQDDETRRPSIDMRLKELDLFVDDKPVKKKRRVGLCEEIIISPRTEEDKRQFKEDVKRYKANKEKLKRQKEKILQQTKKQLKEIELKKSRDRHSKMMVKVKLRDKPEFNSETAKKIKETFRTNMASTVVNSLNAYRKPDCTEGRITNTQDFKHLARKLTHFVMLKEIKHISKIEELTCTDNVKMKAREFIRKYMSKFGEVYVKRSDSPDFKD
ncbi:probable histone-lysine N-methyltransferase CG1716 isoform X2 [Diorhabda sublineata]|uniref:probable histone-lysine N-methyltransferase CG1716 isoform X2 n=1 Tax=Diorhabda sublineata TaxID=1163346 RepID=UPI0024E06312|nr:probable histone-lysine N-methyltransferase CG1716 isoform X2 [Diorhabda sublineata]